MKTNRQQREYKAAKAKLDKLEATKARLEQQFILDNGIVNPDGSVPRLIYLIDDDNTAEKAIEEFSAQIEKSGLWSSILEARERFDKAEEALLEYAISITPAKLHPSLRKATTIYKYRQEMIETVLKLDVSTVKF